MNIIEMRYRLKDLFYKKPTITLDADTRKMDAAVLRHYGIDVMIRRSSSGEKYLYYGVPNKTWRDVMRYMFIRNDLEVEYHVSYYDFNYDGRGTPVFRIKKSEIERNPKRKDFVKMLFNGGDDVADDANAITAHVAKVRAEMKAKKR